MESAGVIGSCRCTRCRITVPAANGESGLAFGWPSTLNAPVAKAVV